MRHLVALLVLPVLLTPGMAMGAEDAALAATALGDGVYAVFGSRNEASPENQGRIGNAGFIVGAEGTIVINTGSSYRHGRELLEMAERMGGKPVVLAVITQPLQEFIMGSAAFADRGIPVLAHEAGAKLIGERCENCLRNLRRLLGDEAMLGTRVVVPARTVSQSGPINAGGRILRLIHVGWGSTPGDLAVFDPASGVLFAGALVSIGRVPDLRDADTEGWLEALHALEELSPRILVPGYGPRGDVSAIAPMRHYIERIFTLVRMRQRGGDSLYETIHGADLAEFSDWTLYPVIHPRNIHRLYLRFENEEFGQ